MYHYNKQLIKETLNKVNKLSKEELKETLKSILVKNI